MPILQEGNRFVITGYKAQNALVERLRELGLVVGTMITIMRKAPFNGPVELQFGRSRLVIRPTDIQHFALSEA